MYNKNILNFMNNNWQAKKISLILKKFGSNEAGLKKKEAEQRLRKYGLNKFPEAKKDSLLVVFCRQFQSPLIFILFAVSIIIFVIGEIVDGAIIFFVLAFNALIGTIQEGRAQNTLMSLRGLMETSAIVLREGKEVVISDKELVPGDIIILQEGERVPADARIIISNNLKIDEAVLTGESMPVHKITEIFKDKETLSIANMVFQGTMIVAGNGKAVVVATGINTKIGKISQKILAIDAEIPLKENIKHLSRAIVFAVLGISFTIFIIGIFFGKSIKEMIITVISLSVSIIPEGLPVVITLILATGVWRMSKRNVLIKRLQAVEALGQADIIAVDKTGTVTKNEMAVRAIYANNIFFKASGLGYESSGNIILKEDKINPLNYPELLLIGKIAAFCSNSRLLFLAKEKTWKVIGDPTEAAMFTFARKIGFSKEKLEKETVLLAQQPFDYKNKYHLSLRNEKEKDFFSMAGAPEAVLNFCDKIWLNGKIVFLTKEEIKKLEQALLNMLEGGFRVVALAMKEGVSGSLDIGKKENFIFVGFLGIKDALRPEVYEAMRKANMAGMRVVMITGDHKITAQAIATEAGIYHQGDRLITGEEIDKLSEGQLIEALQKISVFARVTPEHKLKIIKAYKKRGNIIAMTGDGVNDAPSLVAADLGVAMGKIGTEVAKDASDIILLDDNFGSIVSAIEEGRSIYKTIKKVILYLFSTSMGEVLVISGAIFLGFPLPLLAAQIIWLNLVTDSFLDVALAMEPKEKGLLRRKFAKPKKYFIDSLMLKRIFLMATSMMIGGLFLFSRYLEDDLTKAWTISLTTLAVFQWFNAWNCRHESKSIFQQNPFSNKFLIGATIIVFLLQFLAVYNPFMQKILRTSALTLSEWLLIILISLSIVLVEEIRKFFYRRQIIN
jgi:Ca2+-transporting ATPase